MPPLLLEQPQMLSAPVSPTSAEIAKALWRFLPELLLINSELWATLIVGIWAVGALFHVNQIGFAILALVIGIPGLIATAYTLRIAIINREFA